MCTESPSSILYLCRVFDMASKITVTAERMGRQDPLTLIWHMCLLLRAHWLELVTWPWPTAVEDEKCRRANGYLVNDVSDPLTMISSLPLLPACFFLSHFSFFQCLSSFIFPCFPFIQPLFNKLHIFCAGCLHALKSECLLSYVPYMLLLSHPRPGPATLCHMVSKLRNIPESNMIPHTPVSYSLLSEMWHVGNAVVKENACVVQFLQVMCVGADSISFCTR